MALLRAGSNRKSHQAINSEPTNTDKEKTMDLVEVFKMLLGPVELKIETEGPNKVLVLLDRIHTEREMLVFAPEVPLLIRADVEKAIAATKEVVNAISWVDTWCARNSSARVNKIIEKVMRTAMSKK